MSHWTVIPIFNEVESVGTVVAKAVPYGPVIVVDDGSTDRSGAAARSAGAEVLCHGRRRGKGAALRTGVESAIARGATRILTLDGDGQHNPEEIPLLLEAARRNPRAIVIGDRLFASSVIPPGRLNALRVAGFFINWLTGTWIGDTQCGFRVYPAELFRALDLRRGGFVLETEILLRATQAGYAIEEIPVASIYPPGRRSRFRPVRDGCAIGFFIARRVLARLGIEGWQMLRRFTPPGILAAAGAGWGDGRWRRFGAVGAAILVFPVLLVLTVLHPLASWLSLDLLTPLVRRFYSQDRLARARSEARAVSPVELGR